MSEQYRDVRCEMTRHAGRVTLHDFEAGKYYDLSEAQLAGRPIPWDRYSPRLRPWQSTVFVASFGGLLVLDYGWFFRQQEARLTVAGAATLTVFLAVNVAMHEAAHVVALRICGRRPDKLGFKFNYGVLPAFYVRMNQVLLLSPRERIVCHLAGLWVNLVIAAGVVLTGSLTSGLPAAATSSTYIFLTMLIMNLLPILNSDGQKVLTTLIHRPEVRKWRDSSGPIMMIRVASFLALAAMLARFVETLAYWLRR